MSVAMRELPKDLTMRETFRLPTSFGELTPDSLTRMLERKAPGVVVQSVSFSDVTEGTGTRARLTLEYNSRGQETGSPKTMWMKSWFYAQSSYQAEFDGMSGETIFYKLAHLLPVRAARSYYAGIDEHGQAMVLLEDLAKKRTTFCTATQPLNLAQVRDGLDELARLHGAYWNLPVPRDRTTWPPLPNCGVMGEFMLNRAIPSVGAVVSQPHLLGRLPVQFSSGERFERAMTEVMHRHSRAPHCLIHFDPHLGNTSLTQEGEIFFIDWQFFRAGSWSHDVSYFIGSSLTTENRRQWERGLLEYYLERLQEHGGQPPSFDTAWEAHAVGQLYGVFAWVCTRLEMQSLETIYTLLERHLNAASDLRSFEALGL